MRPEVSGCFLALALLGGSSVATRVCAQGFFSGNKIYEDCQAPGNAINWGLCRGYIVGAIDAYEAETAALHQQPRFCFPDGVTVEQAADITLRYMRLHPEERHASAASLVWLAIFQAFPCTQR